MVHHTGPSQTNHEIKFVKKHGCVTTLLRQATGSGFSTAIARWRSRLRLSSRAQPHKRISNPKTVIVHKAELSLRQGQGVSAGGRGQGLPGSAWEQACSSHHGVCPSVGTQCPRTPAQHSVTSQGAATGGYGHTHTHTHTCAVTGSMMDLGRERSWGLDVDAELIWRLH